MIVDELRLWKRYRLSNGQYLRSNEYDGPDTDIIIHKNRDILKRYWKLFTTYRPSFKSTFKPRTIFEIGVKEGGSLCMWYELFKCLVFGIDNNIMQLSTPSLKYTNGRSIVIGHVDANNPESVMAFKKRHIPGSVDLTIDDCLHTIEQIPYNLLLHWPFVSVGGVYVIEDWKALHPDHREAILLTVSTVPEPRNIHVYDEMIVIDKLSAV